jgi:hypothetical protein
MAQVERYVATAPQGVNFEVEPSQLETTLWDEAENISFDDGGTNKVDGIGLLIEPTFVQGAPDLIEVIVPYKFNNNYRYSYGISTGKVWSVNNLEDPHKDVSPPLTGLQPDTNYKWEGSTINGVGYLCKGVPYYYDETPDVAPYADGRFRPFTNFPSNLKFKTMRTFGNYLVGVGTEEDSVIQENRIWHSSAVNDVDIKEVEWNPTPENDANWVYLGGEGGALIDGLELKNDFIIYREKTAHIMSFIGGNDIFSYRQIFSGFGLLSRNCAVEVAGQHFCVGVSDIYMHDGRNKTTVADSVVKDKLYASIDPTYIDSTFVFADYKRKQVWVCIAEKAKSDVNIKGAATGAYIYDWETQVWSYRIIPFSTCGTYTVLGIADNTQSWEESTGSWSSTTGTWIRTQYNPADWGWLMAGQYYDKTPDSFSSGFSSGYQIGQEAYINSIYNDISDKTYLGNEYSAYVTKKWISFGDDNMYKYVSMVHPIVRGEGELLFDVGYSDYMNGDINWKTGYTYNKDSRRNKPVRVRVNGRYFHLKFNIPEGSNAQIKGYNIEYKGSGKL